MKKSIHIIVKYFLPVTAGIETNIVETYSDLVKMGWQVHLHTSTSTLTELNILPKSETIRGIKVHRYPWHWYGFIPQFNFSQASIVALHNFNIFPHLLIMIKSLWDKLTGRHPYKLVLTPHGGFNPEWSNFAPVSRLVKYIYHYTLGALLINLSVDGVRAVSNWEQSEMITHGLKPKLIQVISNGIESIAFKLDKGLVKNETKKLARNMGKYLIQIGRIYPIKNYETVIKALPLIDETINYLILGPLADLSYKQQLDKLIVNLKLQHRVHFAGVITKHDKFYLIAKSQLMVHMAHWESFCNALHEGMSQGKVCLAANNTALPYLIKTNINGFLLPTTDYKQLAKTITKVLSPKFTSIKKKIEANNLTESRNHSWTLVAGKMNNWYQQLITL